MALASTAILGSEFHGPHDRILLSHGLRPQFSQISDPVLSVFFAIFVGYSFPWKPNAKLVSIWNKKVTAISGSSSVGIKVPTFAEKDTSIGIIIIIIIMLLLCSHFPRTFQVDCVQY
jgi:hypothetical protein